MSTVGGKLFLVLPPNASAELIRRAGMVADVVLSRKLDPIADQDAMMREAQTCVGQEAKGEGMKVADLIKALSAMPQGAAVVAQHPDSGRVGDEITEVLATKHGFVALLSVGVSDDYLAELSSDVPIMPDKGGITRKM